MKTILLLIPLLCGQALAGPMHGSWPRVELSNVPSAKFNVSKEVEYCESEVKNVVRTLEAAGQAVLKVSGRCGEHSSVTVYFVAKSSA